MKNLIRTLNPNYIKGLFNPKRGRKYLLFSAFFVFVLLMHSCENNEVNFSDKVDQNELNMQYEEFKAYLIELEKQSGVDIPQNPLLDKKSDKNQSSFRSCSMDCDYDLEDCGLTCDDPVSYSESISISGCTIYYTFDLLRCEDIYGQLVYNQIVNFTWWPDSGCTHFGINAGYDINYTGGSKTTYDQNNNLVTGYILNNIEEQIIYPLLDTEGATAYSGNIISVIPKECYAYCDADELYKVCGEGCCIRSTVFDIDEGTVDSEVTQNVSNSDVGTCRNNPITFTCSTTSTCDEELDCDIETFE